MTDRFLYGGNIARQWFKRVALMREVVASIWCVSTKTYMISFIFSYSLIHVTIAIRSDVELSNTT